MPEVSLPEVSLPVGPRRRAARGQGGALRDEILLAARDLLAETGDVDAVSIRAVAKQVGVSAPAIYLHFTDKQALLAAVCESVFDAIAVRMQAAGERVAEPFQALRLQGIAYVEFALENPEHYRIVLMHRAQASLQPDTAVALAGGSFLYLVASVQRCVEAGVFAGDPVSLAMRLWAAAHGVAAMLISKPDFPWPAGFVADTITMAGLGLVLESRLAELPGLAEQLSWALEGPTR